MIRNVLKYGHPALRQKGERVEKITPAVKALVEDLLETMYAAKGIGLAAQQIGHAVQVTVIDVRGLDLPSTLEFGGKPVNVDESMPMVLINPEVKSLGESVSGREGCLSFPDIFADIWRPAIAHVTATNDKGERVEFRCSGLLARAILHEVDHLNGVLFIDRMDSATKAEFKTKLTTLHSNTKAERGPTASRLSYH